MPVRLKDIANDLNLSKMTISKVLRGQTDVSSETKARVLQRVKELNYRPNITARSLRTGQTFTMGLIVPGMQEHYIAELASGVDEVVRAAGYGLVVCPVQDDPELEQRQIELLLSRQVDALLIMPVQERTLFFQQFFEGQTKPIIFVSRRLSAGGLESFVGLQEEEVGRISVEHLIAGGHKRIAYLRGPRTPAGDLRYAGFRHALLDAGLPLNPELVLERTGAQEGEYRHGFEGMLRLMDGRGRPDGVVAYTDLMAVGAMDAALSRGAKVPERIGFIGSGNDARLCEMRVPLSSVDLAAHETGQKAGRMALRLVADSGAAGVRKLLLSPKMVVRASSRRL